MPVETKFAAEITVVEEQTRLIGERVSLEPVRAAHAELIYPGLSHRELACDKDELAPSLEALRGKLEQLERDPTAGGGELCLSWAARVARRGPYVGLFMATVHPNCSATVRCWIWPPFWRRGFARDGMNLTIDHLFRERGVRSVRAHVAQQNEAARALLASTGFEAMIEAADDELAGCITYSRTPP